MARDIVSQVVGIYRSNKSTIRPEKEKTTRGDFGQVITNKYYAPSAIFDVVTAESHKAENDVTDFPIEDGTKISNHVVILPDELEIRAEVSNYDGPYLPARGEFAKSALDELKRIRNNRDLVEVVTQHETYTTMQITSITAEHIAPYTGRLQFVIKLKKVNFSASDTEDDSRFDFARQVLSRLRSASQLVTSGQKAILYLASRSDTISRAVDSVIHTNWELPNDLDASYEFPDGTTLAQLKTTIRDSAELLPLSSLGSESTSLRYVGQSERDSGLTTKYNYQQGAWLANIQDSSGSDKLYGISLLPGIDVAHGNIELEDSIGVILPTTASSSTEIGPNSLGSDSSAELTVVTFPKDVYESIQQTIRESNVGLGFGLGHNNEYDRYEGLGYDTVPYDLIQDIERDGWYVGLIPQDLIDAYGGVDELQDVLNQLEQLANVDMPASIGA